MTNEVDLAMELSVAKRQVRAVEARLFSLMFEAHLFTCAAQELVHSILTADPEETNKSICTVAEWSVDMEINLLVNLLQPATDTKFTELDATNPVDAKKIFRSMQTILTDFQDCGAKHAENTSLEWDRLVQPINQGTRSQRVEACKQAVKKVAEVGLKKLSGHKQKDLH